jgi:hypothetical protein
VNGNGFTGVVGFFDTVNVAASDSADPALFENTARYCVPDSPVVTFARSNVVDVAPATGAHEPEPFFDSHCTDGTGEPEAAAEKLTEAPSTTDTLSGDDDTTGATSTTGAATTENSTEGLRP